MSAAMTIEPAEACFPQYFLACDLNPVQLLQIVKLATRIRPLHLIEVFSVGVHLSALTSASFVPKQQQVSSSTHCFLFLSL